MIILDVAHFCCSPYYIMQFIKVNKTQTKRSNKMNINELLFKLDKNKYNNSVVLLMKIVLKS